MAPVETTMLDLLFIELMSHLSRIKQIYSQPIHAKHLCTILCIRITRGRYILMDIQLRKVTAEIGPLTNVVGNNYHRDEGLSQPSLERLPSKVTALP